MSTRPNISTSRSLVAAGAALLLLSTSVRAQIIIDRRPTIIVPQMLEISEITVDAQVREQAAQVQVTQVFRNTGSVVLEAEYFFPLPEESAVQDVVLLVDGKEIPGRILPQDEARRIYEEIVRSKRDPALLEYMGRGLFRTSVFPIPPGQSRTVTMRTTYLCRRDRDLVEFMYPLSTQKHSSKPVGRTAVTVNIETKEPLKTVYSPLPGVVIERPNDRKAIARYEQRQSVPAGDFRLFYGLADGAVGATILSYRPSDGDDGYFLLLASPAVKSDRSQPIAKTVVFVLDRSGSMAGKKIEQARDALRFVLNNLREGDLFNIVVYESQVETFKPELQAFTPQTRAAAQSFVDNIRPGGSTNIDEGLKTALNMLQDKERPNYVLFLTDGLPTAGEQRETAIADNAKAYNKAGARIFAFGVGYDVNSRLLDRLSGGNGGISEYVKPEDDLEAAVSRLYSRLSSPVLTGIHVEVAGSDINRTYPKDLPDLFEGGQLVWTGRYRQSGPAKVALSGKIGQQDFRLKVEADLAAANRGVSHAFVERLWATRRIGSIIDEIDLRGKNQELIDELVALSKKYGILTPYTAFLADERVPLAAKAEQLSRANEASDKLGQAYGREGFAQRQYKAGLMQSSAAPATPALQFAGADGSKETPVTTMRQIASKTFYRRDGRWIDSTVTPEEEAKAVVVEQFTDDYFRLARAQSADLNQYLNFDEEATVKLGDRVYRITQQKR